METQLPAPHLAPVAEAAAKQSIAWLDILLAVTIALAAWLVIDGRSAAQVAMQHERDQLASCREEQGRLWATPEAARAKALSCAGLEHAFQQRHHRSAH